jgi:hypothetical protein
MCACARVRGRVCYRVRDVCNKYVDNVCMYVACVYDVSCVCVEVRGQVV